VPRNTLFYLPIGKHKLESTTQGSLPSFSVLNSHDLFSLPLSRCRRHQFVSIASGSFCSIPLFFLYLFLCLLFDGFSVLFFLPLLYGFSALFSFLCFLLFYDFFCLFPCLLVFDVMIYECFMRFECYI